MIKKMSTVLLAMLCVILVFGQPFPANYNPESLKMTKSKDKENLYEFELKLPKLIQAPGADKHAYYSYYINYGDGTDEKGSLPDYESKLVKEHKYNQKPTYYPFVRIYNNFGKGNIVGDVENPKFIGSLDYYLKGKRIPKVMIDKKKELSKNNNSEFKINVDYSFSPKHDQDSNRLAPNTKVVIGIDYQSPNSIESMKGQLVVFFNEVQKQKEKDVFRFLKKDIRLYHKEMPKENLKQIPHKVQKRYKAPLVWEVEATSNKQRLTIDLETLETKKEIKTKIIVFFIPHDRKYKSKNYKEFPISIIIPHDPNKVKGSYKTHVFKPDTHGYTVYFENEEDGVARRIKIICVDKEANLSKDLEIKEIKLGNKIYYQRKNKKRDDPLKEYIEDAFDSLKLKIKGNNTIIFDLNDIHFAKPSKKKSVKGYIKFEVVPINKFRSTSLTASIRFNNQDYEKTNRDKVEYGKKINLELVGGIGINNSISESSRGYNIIDNGIIFLRPRIEIALGKQKKNSLIAELNTTNSIFTPNKLVNVLACHGDSVSHRRNFLDEIYFSPQIRFSFFSRKLKLHLGLNAPLSIIRNAVTIPDDVEVTSNIGPLMDLQLDQRWFKLGGRLLKPLDLCLLRDSFNDWGNLHVEIYFAMRINLLGLGNK